MMGPATLEVLPTGLPADVECARREEASLDAAETLDHFLAGVERRAFRIAQMALRDRDDALDVVQDAMLHLARSYGGRPSGEWRPLFYRILYNGIRDKQRRRTVRSRLFGLLPGSHADEDGPREDPLERVADGAPGPDRQLMADQAMQRLEIGGRCAAGASTGGLHVALSGGAWTSQKPPPRWAVPRAA